MFFHAKFEKLSIFNECYDQRDVGESCDRKNDNKNKEFAVYIAAQ